MIDDLLIGARVLARQPPGARAAMADLLLYQAHAADCFAKRFGTPHPRWGNGSLMARALAEPLAPTLSVLPCFGSLAEMAAAIMRFRTRLTPS